MFGGMSLPTTADEARARFETASDKLRNFASQHFQTAEGAPAEVAHLTALLHIAAAEWGVLAGVDLKKAAADYLAGAHENAASAERNAKHMKIATIFIAAATGLYVLVAAGQWIWPKTTTTTNNVVVPAPVVNLSPVINLPPQPRQSGK